MRTIRGVFIGKSDLAWRGLALKPKPRTLMTDVEVDWHKSEKPLFCWERLDFSSPGKFLSKLGYGSIHAGTRYCASPT